MEYIDSNIFILAALASDQRAISAQKILQEIIGGKRKALTSTLTFDEIVWVFLKHTRNREASIEQGQRILLFDNLSIASVTEENVRISFSLMKKYSVLKPRDAIHLAVALSANASAFITDDSDFLVIKEIKIIPLVH